MMTSSHDELIPHAANPPSSVEHLTVVRGKRTALDDVTVRIAAGTITGLLGPSGCGKTTLMRSIVGTQIIASGTVTVLGHPAGSAELRHRVGYVTQDATIYDDLRVVDNVRYFASLYGSDVDGRRRVDRRPSGSTIIERRCAATCPADSAPGRRWPAHWWPTPTCWCSTNRPSASTRCSGSTCGNSSTSWRAGARRCWCPATSWTKPTTAATCCCCARAACWPTPPRPDCERTPDVSHWRKRFCPSFGTAPQPAARRLSPQAYLATTGRILRQLAGDHRSVAMIVVVPSAIITLMYFMFQDVPHRPGTPSPFDNACLIMLGVFPLIVMFLITSITMQRERVSGTLERILTTPLRRLDLLAAYGTAFSIAAAAQATLACVISFWLLGLDTAGSPALGVRHRDHQRGARRRTGPAV